MFIGDAVCRERRQLSLAADHSTLARPMMRQTAPKLAGAVALALLAASPAFAQSQPTSVRRPAYGFVAGVNVSKLAGDFVNASSRTGLTAGAYAAFPLATGVAIQPELLYSMEGAKLDIGQNGGMRIDYLRVPVMLRIAVPTASNVRPFAAVGPSFGFETSCKLSGSNGGPTITLSCDDFANVGGSGFERQKFEMAGRIEGGLTVDTAGLRFVVGGSYSHGLTDVFKDHNVKNRVFSVFVGIGL